jgi:hypothetical protein
MIPQRTILKSCSAALCCSSLAGAHAAAAEGTNPLQNPEPAPLNRFSVGYRLGLNTSATFKGAGGGFLLNRGPVANRPGEYDDGYVRPDTTAGDGLTWNWGYASPSQIVGDSLLLSRFQPGALGEHRSTDGNPQQGLEITYQRQLSKPGKVQFGLEAAFNWTDITLRDSRTVPGSVTRMTDAYDLGGIVPPQAAPPDWAYRGTFYGPGPLLGDTPIPQPPATIPNVYTTGSREFEAFVYGFRLGPYLTVPITPRLDCSISGGLALGIVESEFRMNETTWGDGFGPVSASVRDWHSDVLLGGYVSGNVRYAVSRALDVFGGVQFQAFERYEHALGNQSVELDLGAAVFCTVGIGYSF